MSKSEQLLKNLESNLPVLPPSSEDLKKHIDDDYEFSRETYRNLVTKSNDAIEQMLNLAMQSEHPRAFEVLSNMLKNTSDMTDKLMELQKKRKAMTESEDSTPGSAPALTQNNIFMGSTTDLQKHLIDQLKKQNVDTSTDVR
jgi:hypothetical protein